MKKILIVDGYPHVRELLAEELAAEGHTVVPIGNPELIWGLLSSFEPDLFIIEPFMDGKWQWNLLKKIKEQSPGLPVLIFTMDHPSGDRRASLADGWIIKSFNFDELKKKINEIPSNLIRRESSFNYLTPISTDGSNL